MKIAIIGAGASGICAAIKIKENNPSYEVYILEKKNKIASKIAASGNGKCNIGNDFLAEKYYNNEKFYNIYLKNKKELFLNFLRRNNILIKTLDEGRLYPFSESSLSIINALKKSLKFNNINVYYNCEVINFEYIDNQIHILTTGNKFICNKLIIASGGKSYPNLGTNGNIIDLLKKKDIRINNPLPSLTGFILKENVSSLFGLRLKCKASIVNKNQEVMFSEIGEVIFKKDGISGICIMNLSFYLNKYQYYPFKNDLQVSLDLFYDIELSNLLQQIDFDNSNNSLIGIIDEKLINFLKLKKNKVDLLKLKNIIFNIKEFYQFDYAQVTHGGISIEEIKSNFEFKKLPNVYAIGETLDIDGICGGYNIFNAITNGLVLGERLNENNN